MKRRLIACLLFAVLMISLVAPAGKAQAATVFQYEEFTVSEEMVYSLQNVASGWYMNVKHAGKTNGTQINLYPLDMTEPMTQRYVFHMVDADKKVVQISPQPATKMYLDVRRAGKPFKEGQGICIWEADGDPIKNLVLDFQEDGTFYLTFEKYPEYCIGAKSLEAASTQQTQLVVCKKSDASELRWRLCNKDGVPVNDVENVMESWSNPYYEKYGQEYINLFKKYPAYLMNEDFNQITGRYMEECVRILEEHEDETVIGAYLYSLKQGKEIIISNLLSLFGISRSVNEKARLEAVQALMQEICRDETVRYNVATQVEEKFSMVSDTYSLGNAISKSKFIKDLSNATSLSKKDIEKVVEEAYKNADKIEKNIQNKADVVSYVTTALQLYSLNQEIIDYMMESIDMESDLYSDLQLLKDSTGKNTYKYIIDKYFNEKAQKAIGELLVATIGKGNKTFELTTVIAEAGVTFLVDYVYQGALADEIIQTTWLYTYANSLKIAIMGMQTEFLKKDIVTVEEIERYEFLMSAYLSSLKVMTESTKKMAKSEQTFFEGMIKRLEEMISYEVYIGACINSMPSMQKRMDKLVELLDKKYFTVDQEACSMYTHSDCKNCLLSNILKETWFKNEFGELDVNQFPALTVSENKNSRSGWTCFGFACFSEWYINAESRADKVETQRVATGKFTKEFIQGNVKPGDALRVTGPHSMIVYAVEEDGIVVIDCNRALAGYGSCVVQKDKILYTSKYAGRTLYVDRATCNME